MVLCVITIEIKRINQRLVTQINRVPWSLMLMLSCSIYNNYVGLVLARAINPLPTCPMTFAP